MQPCAFLMRCAMLIWLYILSRRPTCHTVSPSTMHHRILDCHKRCIRVVNSPEEVSGSLHRSTPRGILVERRHPYIGQVCARWMPDNQVPSHVHDAACIALEVGNAFRVRVIQVASSHVGSCLLEHLGYHRVPLAGYQHPWTMGALCNSSIDPFPNLH